jgi:lipid-binding SYLF domain-containing protein
MKEHLMPFRRLLVALALVLCLPVSPAVADDDTAELEAKADMALAKLYERSPRARELAEQAAGVLVFPNILKAGLIVGGQYGKGVLRVGGATVGYYSSAAGSYGFQAGVESYGYALILMTDEALARLDAADGWEVGTGPSIVVADEGAGASLTSRTVKADVYAYVFDQKGLMGGIALQGTKITRLERP